MLCFIFKDKEDMVKKISNGEVQYEIYNYLSELIYDAIYYDGMCSNHIDLGNACEYFEAQLDDIFVTHENIINSHDELSSVLHDTIISVYDRFCHEFDEVRKLNKIKNAISLIQEDLGFYYDEYNKGLLDTEDKNEIVKDAMDFYEKIKDIRIY